MTPINVFVIDHARSIACAFLLSFLVAFAVAVFAKWDADTVSIFLLSYFVLGSAAVIRVESLAIQNRLRNPFKKTA